MTEPANQDPSNDDKGEVKGTLIPAQDAPEWGDDLRIIEPGAKTEDGQTVGGDKDPDPEPDDTKTDPEPDPDPEPVTPAATLEDPGEFQPNDYSFTVTVYDSEGKNGKQRKINSVEQFEELVDKDANFGSANEILKANRLAGKMETNLEREKNEHEKRVEAFNAEKERLDNQTQATSNMVNEISYLEDRGDLPKVAKEYQDADWSDPDVAKQAGVKEQISLLNYMRDENKRRMKAKLAPMTSVLDAFNAWQIDESKKKATDTKTQRSQARKEAGGRVASPTPNPTTVAPKGIAVGRGGSLRDLGQGQW